jgi:mono/diheme cytochrome c family protein
MWVILRVLSFSLLLLAGCGAPPPPPPAPPYTNTLAVKQVMEWVIDPAADVIWDSVKSVITEKGTQEIAPKTDADWDKVRDAAATLMEAGNALMIEGRARDKKEWMAAARKLSDAAGNALKAAQAKNTEAVFNEGGNIYKACAACHAQYAQYLQGPPPDPTKKAAEPAKSTPEPAKK